MASSPTASNPPPPATSNSVAPPPEKRTVPFAVPAPPTRAPHNFSALFASATLPPAAPVVLPTLMQRTSVPPLIPCTGEGKSVAPALGAVNTHVGNPEMIKIGTKTFRKRKHNGEICVSVSMPRGRRIVLSPAQVRAITELVKA